jgi:hypothetical protein
MQIERTDGLNPRGVPDNSTGPLRSAGNPGAKEAAPDSQPTAETATEALVRQAATADEINLTAVEEARRLLESGQLDNPEAIRRAAAALLDQGI